MNPLDWWIFLIFWNDTMCFSAQASFAAGGVLIPLGVFSMLRALKMDKRYILFSMIPIIFGIHQLIEGVIWDRLHHAPYTSLYQSILAFTFVAFFVWPIYIPLSVYCIEPSQQRKRILAGVICFGCFLSLAIYFPIIIGLTFVDVTIVQHSISYPIDQPVYLQNLFTICYVLTIFFALFLSSLKEIKIFGGLLLFSLLLTVLWFYFALSSTWCFFSALLSVYIVYFMYQLTPYTAKKLIKKSR